MSNSHSAEASALSAWDRFWFTPDCPRMIARIRAGFCLITAVYFLGSIPDVNEWYAGDAPFAQANVATFFSSAELQSETRWMWSPLFFIEAFLGSQAWIHYLYLAVGTALCVSVALGRGGRVALWLLWIVFAGWANRALFLAGSMEILMSQCLFACAIAMPCSAVGHAGESETRNRTDWTAGFAKRLLALQITLFGMLTWATMLSQDVWWNGLGSYALAAPVENRTIDVTAWLAFDVTHDLATHFLVLALPVGYGLVWLACGSVRMGRIGVATLVLWSMLVAVLGSHWLYAATFATATIALLHSPISRRLHDD